MRKKQFLAVLTAVIMVLGVVPGLAFAADTSLPLLKSYVATSDPTGTYTMDGFTTRPYAVSWTGTGEYRMGVVVFDASAVDKDVVGKATLSMTVSRTQNVNEGSTTSTVTVYAIDPAEADGTNLSEPALGEKVGVISLSGITTQSQSLTSPVSAKLDLSNYFAAYPEAESVALVLTNRDDITECNSRGLVGFYGSESTVYAPTLTLEVSTSAAVKLIADGEAVAESTAENLIIGTAYTPDNSVAPAYLIYNGKVYTRESLPTVTVEENMEVIVSYNEGAVFSDTVIEGNAPLLPAAIAVVSNGGLTYADVDWTASEGEYTAEVSGCTLTAEVETLPCDHSVDTFYSAGAAQDSGFVWYNSLGCEYGGGEVVFETDFIVNSGTNKLISYGNASTSSFAGTAAPLRYMQATNANGEYVFEYHNGDWYSSSVVCKAGEQYRLRTVMDFSTQTYSMYIAGGDGNYQTVTEGSKFRSALTYVDRVFIHGSGDSGVLDGVMLSHRSYWSSGYTNLTVNYVDDNGNSLAKSLTKKVIAGSTYTASDAPKAIIKDGTAYVLEDVTASPEKVVSGESDVFDVVYYKSEAPTIGEVADVNTVQGEALNMPSTVSVVFSNGQSLKYSVNWDTSAVNVDEPGTYTVPGTVSEISGLSASCTVIVKSITVLPYEDNVTVATNNGGWNWYVEPSGTHIQPGDTLAARYESGAYTSNGGYKFQHDRTYMGWVEDDGSIIVSQLDHETGEYKRVVIHDKLESDDHNNPAVVILPDGRIMAVYSMHTNEPYMYFRVSKYPEDISEWNDEWYYYCETNTETEASSGYNATYPTVFMVHDDEGVKGNDVIYVGWRGVHWKPTLAKFSMPDENGQLSVVMGQTQFANTTYGYSTYTGSDAPNAKTDGGKTDDGRRPYTKYDYDSERNKIYITFTANHPDNDKLNHIYYLYLNIEDQNLYTAKDNLLQPLPKENKQAYASQGANGTSGQWGVVTVDLVNAYPELLVFNASEQTNDSFNPRYASAERRGWTWDIKVNEKGEPCIVYVDITATPPTENGGLPTWYLSSQAIYDNPYSDSNSRSHHYYWYARWDSETQEWVKTFLTYGGKWFHENATQERCYSGGLTFDHNAADANVIFLAIPTQGEYGNIFEIYRWESDDHGATWTIREPITQNSPTNNARPNAIYNYKQDPETGENLGPRLLWISGEYRYWMNYEYKTGVKTDYKADGFITQDDPEMFADSVLTGSDGIELDALPIGEEVELTAKFNITNISIGDGTVKLALAHYSKDNELKGFVSTEDITIPARSVPQIGMIGAPKTADGGLSTLGGPEVVETLGYTAATVEEGDRVVLFAWNMGIEHPMSSISSIPYEITTEGNRYLMKETFTYKGTEKLVLNQDESTFNGWVAKGYNSSGAFDLSNNNYVAVTKAPFGNTALHLYSVGEKDTKDSEGKLVEGKGLMVSHSLPAIDEDYTIEFTMRHIDEMSWNNTDNQGFTLSHGIPSAKGDNTNSASAFQYRYKSAWRDENGRGTAGMVRNTIAFDGGSQTEIFHDIDDDNRLWKDSSEYVAVTDGYFDSVDRTYIHDATDSLMTGSLYHVWVSVLPSLKQIVLKVDDGYRTASYTTSYNDTNYDWDANPIDTITFSIGSEKWGEVYIDDFRVYKSNTDGSVIRTVSVQTADGSDLLNTAEWTLIPINGAYVFYDGNGNYLDVSGNNTSAGTKVSAYYEYNGGSNQMFYLVEAEGGYYIQGKQSGRYVSVAADGSATIQDIGNATLFTITDVAEPETVRLEEFLAELGI